MSSNRAYISSRVANDRAKKLVSQCAEVTTKYLLSQGWRFKGYPEKMEFLKRMKRSVNFGGARSE